jgi:hypothetical protein
MRQISERTLAGVPKALASSEEVDRSNCLDRPAIAKTTRLSLGHQRSLTRPQRSSAAWRTCQSLSSLALCRVSSTAGPSKAARATMARRRMTALG